MPSLALGFHLSLCFSSFLKPKSGPSDEVVGWFVYSFSCRYLAQLGLRQLNWVYRLPSRGPSDCEFLRPLQHTKPPLSAKIHPKIHPESSLPKPKNTEKIRKKLRKPPIFVHFSYFFRRNLVSGGGSGCILGCILVLRGVLYSVGGARTRNPRITIPLVCYRIGFGPPARNRKK